MHTVQKTVQADILSEEQDVNNKLGYISKCSIVLLPFEKCFSSSLSISFLNNTVFRLLF
jgi:hypothetical protein